MTATTYIGIDVSKLTLDFCIYDKISKHFIQIANTSTALEGIFETDGVLKKIRKTKTFFCLEDTGLYKNILVAYLQKKKFRFAVPSALHIKYSMGITRGKTDKLDAERIAIFASKHEAELQQWLPQRTILVAFKELVSLWKKLKVVRMALKKRIKEGSDFHAQKLNTLIAAHCESTIRAIDKDIANIEADMRSIIESDGTLHRLYEILSSVKGVGDVLAYTLIVVTNEFKKFPGPNQFACYAGVAPFERSSGTSLNKKPHVSRLANKEVKRLLHLSAMSAIRYAGEYKRYYQRKVKENKPKMVVLNAIRNKIIKRVFCCVNENRLYKQR